MNKKKPLNALKNLTTENLPDFLALIPVVGLPLSTASKIYNSMNDANDAYDQELDIESMKSQISSLKSKIEGQDQGIDLSKITTLILDQMEEEDGYDYIYYAGITLYMPEKAHLGEEEKKEMHDILSKAYDSFIIDEFMEEYCNDKEYYIFEDRIYINFDTDNMFDIETTLSIKEESIRFLDAINACRASTTPIRKYKFY